MSHASTAANSDPLLSRFQDIFDRIAAGSIARENDRTLPFEAVQWLKDSGFTSLRVPQQQGGSGVSLSQFFSLLIRLAEADSNLPQILRVNAGFTELLLERKDDADTRHWLSVIGSGQSVGAATSERTNSTTNSVVLSSDSQPDHWRLNGEKYYSTGTLYADWILVRAHDQESDLNVLVRSDAPGVQRIDDWDGFGQRLTGSGTTRFEDVLVPRAQILDRYHASQPRRNSIITTFYQTVHLATLAGIARAVQRDAVAFTQARTRTFGVPGQSSPRDNPLVHRVVGRLASLAWSSEQLVNALAGAIDKVHLARLAGHASTADYVALDIQTFQAQQIVIGQVLEATTLLFEVGGASATSDKRRLDRHWRNARTLASHNPATQREAAIGDFHLNDNAPNERFALAYA
ncbi:alkylation response protein AidB-like acyl-CoA dehydrogenase [Herbaspirillum sp. Sphag1AN]|uniref:acyl-CoA dehydrogenase family protein n=1 Tax=unclassified Herbaspirillum TaxID=2624150 RepID=UPI00160ED3E9|nr:MULTISPECIES: acyl-CoA dehydrogenase family protein [unclassified Herbaspirillum]MBB3212944.1 alkylation response protein AidB-like acyl-CoA dehydrogenase [Herbaspirillum sp. Sphag1AN]MBB3246141.1 alkylation response protein AidB-like acyl-CoA dehydrogenase [Herbaspirillum sp. Sphag64]